MSSINLYYAPLEKRNKVYFLDSKYQQSNYVRDYNLNQFIIDEINSQQNLYSDFQKSKEVLNTLEESQKRVTGTEQTKKALKKELKLLMLEPEKNKEEILRITQNPIFALPPSTTKAQKAKQLALPPGSPEYLTPEIITKLESENKGTPSPARTPKSNPSRDKEGKLTPMSQLAEDAKIRVFLRGKPDYERLRVLKEPGKKYPTVKRLELFANKLNPPLAIPEDIKSKPRQLTDFIINELYLREQAPTVVPEPQPLNSSLRASLNENDEWDGMPTFKMYEEKRKAQQSKGEGEGLLSILKKNKTNNIPLTSKVVFYVHKKNVKTTRKKKLPKSKK